MAKRPGRANQAPGGGAPGGGAAGGGAAGRAKARGGGGRRGRRGDRAASMPRRLRQPSSLALGAILAVLALVVVVALSGQDPAGLSLGAVVAAAALAALAGGVLAVMVVRRLRSISRAQRALLRGERQRDARDRARHARTRRAVDRAERRLFAQLEALGWLRELLALEHPLPPTRHWAASPDLLLELVRIIDRSRPSSILELGSGVSTVVMAARLKAAGGGRLVALEHEPAYAEETRRNLALQGLDDVAAVLDTPLSDVRVGENEQRWYALPDEGLPPRIDLLLVDGPPGSTGRLARYPALPLLASRLAPGATIVVDDADRPDEREMAQRWQAEQAGLTIRHVPLESGAFVLRMPD